jgi:O-antigen ligase
VPGGGFEAADSGRRLVAASSAARTRTGRLADAAEAGLGAAALLYFPLLVLAPRGIAALALTSAVLGLGLVLARSRDTGVRISFNLPAVLLATLVVWGLVSAAWSPDWWRSVDQAVRLTGLVVAALAMTAAGVISAPRRLGLFLLAGFSVAMLIAIVDLATAGALSKAFSDRIYQPAWLNQAADGFAILLLPAAAALAGSGYRRPALALSAAGALTILMLDGTAAKAALAAGAAVGLLCCWRRAWVARVAAVLTVFAVITAPLSFGRLDRVSSIHHTADAVKLSAGHRLLIWSFVADRIAEHPLRGWGLDSSRAIPGGSDPIRPGETWLPLHPHNAPLQVWLELGVPGAVLLALLCGWLWLALAAVPWPRLYGAAAAGSLTAGLAASVATYGVWQEWWQGTLSFSLFMVLVMARSAPAAVETR